MCGAASDHSKAFVESEESEPREEIRPVRSAGEDTGQGDSRLCWPLNTGVKLTVTTRVELDEWLDTPFGFFLLKIYKKGREGN